MTSPKESATPSKDEAVKEKMNGAVTEVRLKTAGAIATMVGGWVKGMSEKALWGGVIR